MPKEEMPVAEKPMDSFTDNTKKLAELKPFDMSDAALQAFMAERQKLTEENNEYGNTQQEAIDVHPEMKAQAEAREAAAKEATEEQAQIAEETRQSELAQAAELAKQIKTGALGEQPEDPLADAHVKKFEAVLESTTKYLKQEVDNFVNSINEYFKGRKEDTILHIEARANALKIWDAKVYKIDREREENAKQREGSRQYEQVESVKKSIASSSADVAAAIDAAVKRASDAGSPRFRDAVIDFLSYPASWVKGSQTPEFKKVAAQVTGKLIDFVNADFEKANNPDGLTHSQLLAKRDKFLKDPSQGTLLRTAESFKEFRLMGIPEMMKHIPLPEIPEEVSVSDLKSLLTSYQGQDFAAIARKSLLKE